MIYLNSLSLYTGHHPVPVFSSPPPQHKVPDQDIAQGSYIALPLTLLLLLAAYNHEKVRQRAGWSRSGSARTSGEPLGRRVNRGLL